MACDKDHTGTARALVKAGANVEAKDTTFGQTPLIWASSRGHLGPVKCLVEEGGVNMEVKDVNGWASLPLAKKKGLSDVEQYLRSKGATE